MSAGAAPADRRFFMLADMTAAQFAASFFQQGVGSLAPFLIASFAVSKAEFGLAFTAMSIGSALTTTPAGVLVDRIGERAVIAFSGLAMGLSLVAAAMVPAFAWLVLWMFVFGACYAFSTPAGGRAVLTWFAHERGFAMGIRQTGVTLGGVLGGISLPVLAAYAGYRTSFIVAGVLTVVVSVAAALLYRDPPVDEASGRGAVKAPDGPHLREIVRDSRVWFFIVTAMILVCVQVCTNSFIAVTAIADVRVPAEIAGTAFAVMQIGATIGRAAWGVASDKYFGGDRAVPLGILCLGAALGSVVLAYAHAGQLLSLFAAATLIGLAGLGWNGLFAAAMAEIGGAQSAGRVIGFALTFVFFAGAAAPPVFGAIADRAGLPAAWLTLAFVSACGVIPAFAAWRANARAEAMKDRAEAAE